MSTSFAHLPIVTDGLIFSVDPYNTKSYVSGSTNVTDLKNGVIGTLYNGITFDNLSWNTNGTNQYIDFGSGTTLNFGPADPFTIDMWVYVESVPVSDGRMLTKYGGSGVDNEGWGTRVLSDGTISAFLTGASSVRQKTIVTVDPINFTEWVNLTWTVDNSVNASGMSLYVNGQLKNSTNPVDTLLITDSTDTPEPMVFGKSSFFNLRFFDGFFGKGGVYNRELSANEVLQNHNAIKGRYLTW
jgi:hypothetical protein